MSDFESNRGQFRNSFELASEEELAFCANGIYEKLKGFIGEALAKDCADYLLDEAKIIEHTLKELLAKEDVKRDSTYDGNSFFVPSVGLSSAPSGLNMLRSILEVHINSFFKEKEYSRSSSGEDNVERLSKMLDYIATNYINRIQYVKERYEERGRVVGSVTDYNVLGVLGNDSPEDQEEAEAHIRLLQERARIRERIREKIKSDPFFASLEEQMGEKNGEES